MGDGKQTINVFKQNCRSVSGRILVVLLVYRSFYHYLLLIRIL